MKTRLVERGQGIRFVTNSGLQFLSLIQIAFALPTGVIDVDNFEFGIEIQGRRTLFAIADARAFCATEGNVRFTAGRRRVDVGHASFNVVDKTKDARGIVAKDRRRQSVFAIVGYLHGVFEVFDAQDRQDRSEDFFTSNTHIGSDMVEDSWSNKISFVESIAGCARTATHELSAIFLTNVDVVQHSIELTLIYTGSHFSLWIRTNSDAH